MWLAVLELQDIWGAALVWRTYVANFINK